MKEKRGHQSRHVKYWEIIANNLSKTGWSLGWVSALDSDGRTIWILDAHRDNGKRFVVRADEKLTAFIELESAVGADQRLAASHGQASVDLRLPAAIAKS